MGVGESDDKAPPTAGSEKLRLYTTETGMSVASHPNAELYLSAYLLGLWRFMVRFIVNFLARFIVGISSSQKTKLPKSRSAKFKAPPTGSQKLYVVTNQASVSAA